MPGSLLSFFFFFLNFLNLRVQAKSGGQDMKSHCVASYSKGLL